MQAGTDTYPLRFVSSMNAVVAVASLAALLSTVWLPPASIATLVIMVACVLSAGLSQWCLRFGVRVSAMVLCTLFWLLAAANALLFSGVHASGMVLFPFVVAVAGWMLGDRWLVGFSLASVLFVGGLGASEALGWFTPTPRISGMAAAVTYMVVLPVITFLTWGARSSLVFKHRQAKESSRELEHMYAQAQHAKDELQSIMENVPAALSWIGADNITRRCNQRYADLYGVTAASLVGKHTDEYLPEVVRDLARSPWDAVLKGEPQSYRRFHVHPVTSAVTWLEVALWPEWHDGQVTGVYSCALDITDKVQAEAQLLSLNMQLEQRAEARTRELIQAQEKLQETHDELLRSQGAVSLVAMVAGVAHELGSPVGNSRLAASASLDLVRGLSAKLDSGQLTKTDLASGFAMLREGASILESNLGRAESLLQNFRQVSADQVSEQRRSFDLADTVTEVLGSMAPMLRRQAHQLQVDIPAGIVMHSLPGPLGQVLINLVNNAYLHAFDGMPYGHLQVAAQRSADNEHVVITVTDNGCGMSEQVILRLFEPFFSTRIGSGGTGLGMGIVKRIVEGMLGGSIQVESALGQGTRFVIQLPLQAPISEVA